MPQLIRLFYRLCILRSNPQDFPPSRVLEALCIFTYACISVSVGISLELGTGLALFRGLVKTLLLLGLGFAGLWVVDKPSRRCQTTIALTGSGAAFSLVAWPLWVTLNQLAVDATLARLLVIIALCVLVVWSLVVIAHILRQALAVSHAVAGGITLLYAIFSIKVTLFIIKGPLLSAN